MTGHGRHRAPCTAHACGSARRCSSNYPIVQHSLQHSLGLQPKACSTRSTGSTAHGASAGTAPDTAPGHGTESAAPRCPRPRQHTARTLRPRPAQPPAGWRMTVLQRHRRRRGPPGRCCPPATLRPGRRRAPRPPRCRRSCPPGRPASCSTSGRRLWSWRQCLVAAMVGRPGRDGPPRSHLQAASGARAISISSGQTVVSDCITLLQERSEAPVPLL